MKRKLLSLLLVLALVLAVFPVSAFAWSDGPGLQLEKDGLLYSGGIGSGVTVTGLDPNAEEPITDVRIPEYFADDTPVVGIAKGAFKGTNITSVIIPKTVESVEGEAFMDCADLTDVQFDGDFSYVGDDCFRNCTSLTKMYVPDTRVLKPGVFAGCTSLTDVVLEYGFVEIEEGSFEGCTALKYIYIPASMEKIFTKDFEGLKDVVVCGIPGIKNDPSVAEQFAAQMGFQFEADDYPSDNEAVFSDVTGGEYYSLPVLWGYTALVVAGYDDGRFGPDDTCTRADMITFLWRMNDYPQPEAGGLNYHKFCDVPIDAYYTVAVQWAYEQGITVGTGLNKDGEDTFSPNDPVKREEVISLLWRMDGEPEATVTNTPFEDVNAKGYYYPALLWAGETKVVAGTSATTFGPGERCTRGQIITFMYRNLHHLNRYKDPDGKFI